MSRRGLLAALALSALLGAACSPDRNDDGLSAQQRSDPRPEAGEAPSPSRTDDRLVVPTTWQPAPLNWSDCPADPGVQCAELEVPRDWRDTLGPTITLSLARTRATGDRIGSLITNPGGPGGSGVDFVMRAPFGEAITSRFDVVSWDPRGVGASTAVTCGTAVAPMLALDPEPDDAQEQRALEAAAEAVTDECAALDGELLAHLGTEQVALDLEAIRLALGEASLNYIGFSYGTHIGQLYAERFPQHIRAMVLDGIVDTDQGFEEFLIGQAVAFEDAFERGAQACADAGPARCGVGDLIEAYDQVMAMAEADQLRRTGPPAGPSDVVTAAVFSAYSPRGWERLGPALDTALHGGNGAALRDLAESYRAMANYSPYAAVVCIDSPPPQGFDEYRRFAERAARAAPRFGAAVANELLPCAQWPAEPAEPQPPVTADGSPPFLLIGNTGDPATPLDNAVAAAARMPSARLLTVEMEGHLAYGSNPCATEIVHAYLLRLELASAPQRCT